MGRGERADQNVRFKKPKRDNIYARTADADFRHSDFGHGSVAEREAEAKRFASLSAPGHDAFVVTPAAARGKLHVVPYKLGSLPTGFWTEVQITTHFELPASERAAVSQKSALSVNAAPAVNVWWPLAPE